MAIAYFITFSTYGTWLHGTAKGQGSVDDEHNEHGREFAPPDPQREQQMRNAMNQEVYAMTPAERIIVRDAITAVCQEREWDVLAVHVRSSHVHVVVAANQDPGRLMSDLKARASRELTRAGFGDSSRKRWTRHGSTLHLFDERAVAEKIDYTLNQQGTPMAVYPAPTPQRASK